MHMLHEPMTKVTDQRLSSGKVVALTKNRAGATRLVRFLPDGTLDTTFGRHGVVAIPVKPVGLAVQADDKILVLGDALLRFTPAGRPDLSFGTDGLLTWPELVARFITGDTRTAPRALPACITPC